LKADAALVAAAWLSLANISFAGSPAEFAIRWDPAEGGPKTIEEAAALLGLPIGKHKSFEVRYFSIRQPSDATGQTSAIVRQRSSGHATESMYKQRSVDPFSGGDPLAGWLCPFPARASPKAKSEVDVGWTAEGLPKKSYSLSCQVDGTVELLLPAQFMAKPLGCLSHVLRAQAQGIKIERWRLPKGALSIEVSWNGEDTAADLEQFTGRVARPLMAHGVKPLGASKTTLGSDC
jgi:hypothetical protein